MKISQEHLLWVLQRAQYIRSTACGCNCSADIVTMMVLLGDGEFLCISTLFFKKEIDKQAKKNHNKDHLGVFKYNLNTNKHTHDPK